MLQKIKDVGIKAVPFIVILGIGYFAGWATKPNNVRIEEKLKVVEVTKEVVVEKEVVKLVKDTNIKEKYHRESLETKLPDGTYTKKETEDRNIDTVVKETEEKVRVVEVTKEVVVEKEVERIVEAQKAQWRASPLIGTNVAFLPKPNIGGFVWGAEVERRILGPFWLGVWGLSSGQVGVKVSGEW